MPRRDAKDQLSARETAFVHWFVILDNGAEAARRAGYSARNADAAANNLRKKPLIAQAIEEAQAIIAARAAEKIDTALESAAEYAAERALSEQYVLDRLMENVERAMQREPVLDSKGLPTGEWKYDGKTANGALKLLGEHLGMFKQKVELTGRDGEPLTVTVIRRIVRPEAAET